MRWSARWKEIEKVVSEKMGRSISQGPLGALKMHMNFNDLSLMWMLIGRTKRNCRNK